MLTPEEAIEHRRESLRQFSKRNPGYFVKKEQEWRKRNPERAYEVATAAQVRHHEKHPNARRNIRLKARYGITLKQYGRILRKQGGGCAICGKKKRPSGKALDVDHDHKTNAVRGILCSKCNTKLGVLEDKKFKRKAKKYLQQFK